jgi:hypothetical protein
VTRALLAFVSLAASAAAARAAGGLEYAPPAAPAPPDPAGLVLRLVGLTAALLTACAGALWYARRAARPKGLKGDGGGRLRHEATLPLDRRCAVHLVRADGQTVAVTTDATGVRSIVLLSEPFDAELDAATASLPPE